MTLAPIVLFVYNRPKHTEQTLIALMKNDLSKDSILYIYADGPKADASEDDLKKIAEVRALIKSQQWCGEVHIIESDRNKGLADSIVKGVTETVDKYGKVIVVEDDIETSVGFLTYMNDALNLHENNEKIMSVAGFMFPIDSEGLPHTFCFDAGTCWGWATWKRAWKYFDVDIERIYNRLENENVDWRKFNALQGTSYQEQLMYNVRGTLKTWAVKWQAAIYLNKGTALHPRQSLVKNLGFDGSGMNCDDNEVYRNMLIADYIKVEPLKNMYSKEAHKRLKEYFQTPTDRLYRLKRIVWRIQRAIKHK
ncbi:glycosyl transferase family 2 [Dysgonomonas alginatilytica]|uniref:Glycosyl transferase family 2 n=1 Tax=Dysgonomonas alginatilytica TaxID=1605892 RepID=A0A2V3PPB7_9BACT|nr:glycosyltransferase [Dysgonomonas alginatilytica]PXV64134.1 glycosyl transferase family 2 [Dysgonomonas alginatilytica]